MTWEELKEKAKELNNIEVMTDYDKYILISQQGNHYIKFSENGDISVVFDWDVDDIGYCFLCEKFDDSRHAGRSD